MKKASPADAYGVYLKERERYAASPAFYLDSADYFVRADRRDLGLRVLTGILDLRLEDPRLLRVVAHRLQQLGELDLAIPLFEQVLRLRPEEPQSARDLALALAERGDAGRAARRHPREISSDYLRALDLLNTVILGEWNDRFPEIEVVALMDANRLIAVMQREKLPDLDRVELDKRLRQLLDVDVRITLTWDTDETDMDLWVTEPTGEKCDYSHNRTAIGGMISKDFTEGYGPEEYFVRRARPGAYAIQANFYGSQAQSLVGPTTAQATVITNFGRPNEERRTLTLRLSSEEKVVDIGSIRFGSVANGEPAP
jgi:tetratricopeptide (TPR) repeat protein